MVPVPYSEPLFANQDEWLRWCCRLFRIQSQPTRILVAAIKKACNITGKTKAVFHISRKASWRGSLRWRNDLSPTFDYTKFSTPCRSAFWNSNRKHNSTTCRSLRVCTSLYGQTFRSFICVNNLREISTQIAERTFCRLHLFFDTCWYSEPSQMAHDRHGRWGRFVSIWSFAKLSVSTAKKEKENQKRVAHIQIWEVVSTECLVRGPWHALLSAKCVFHGRGKLRRYR